MLVKHRHRYFAYQVTNVYTTSILFIFYFRYFVTEVLETIAPPYSQEFVSLFLPLVENEEITGSMKVDMESDPVSEFIVHCKATHGTNHVA